jgi:hypothetical protein
MTMFTFCYAAYRESGEHLTPASVFVSGYQPVMGLTCPPIIGDHRAVPLMTYLMNRVDPLVCWE